jgi:hypothetical protein
MITIALAWFTLTVFAQDATQTIKQDTLIMTGIIHKRPFVDKMDQEHYDVMDYWFKTDEEDYFIKLSESEINSGSLNKYIDKTARLKYIVKYGEWDSTGKELIPVQSRVGKYIVVFKLIGI